MRQDITGGWVELRDPRQVPERLRRPLLTMTAGIVDKFGEGEMDRVDAEQMQFMSDFNDLLALAVVKEWSFGEVNLETLLDLPGIAYDEVRQLVSPLITDLMPDFGPSPDPKADTAN